MTGTARPTTRILVLAVIAALLGALLTVATRTNPAAAAKPIQPVLLFVADGMRQDIVARYASEKKGVPTLGANAEGRRVGDRQRYAHASAAEHRLGLVHDRDRRVAGCARFDEQHVPRQRPALRELDERARRRPTCCRPSRSPRSAERAGKKVAQIEYAGGRAAAINGPTVDFRSFLSGRGVVTNYISPTDDPPFTCSVRFPVRPPGRLLEPASVPGRRARRRDRLDRCAEQLQPRDGNAHAGARLRRRQVRTERVHLRLHQRRHDQLRPRALLAHEERRRLRRPTSREDEWADVKVTVQGGHAQRDSPAASSSRSRSSRPTSRSTACSTPR